MSVHTIGTLVVAGLLSLALYSGWQPSITNTIPDSPNHRPFAQAPLIPEKLLIGEYTLGSSFVSQHLELKPDHHFSYQLYTCVGGSENQGTWEQQGEVIVLHPEDRTSLGSESLDLKFIPATYKNRLYLIDENEMPSFCHDLFLKDPSGISGHYEKKLSPSSATTIKIPERFRDFVERGQITVRVASIDEEGTAILEGADVSRLQPGMRLCWRKEEGGWKRELRVLTVHTKFARARQVSIHSEHEDKVRPYDLFTTGIGYMTPESTGQTSE